MGRESRCIAKHTSYTRKPRCWYYAWKPRNPWNDPTRGQQVYSYCWMDYKLGPAAREWPDFRENWQRTNQTAFTGTEILIIQLYPITEDDLFVDPSICTRKANCYSSSSDENSLVNFINPKGIIVLNLPWLNVLCNGCQIFHCKVQVAFHLTKQ